MSELRDQLQAAREAHRARRYPGDLAAEMLVPRANWWPRVIGTLVSGAAAAIIVIFLLNHTIDQTPPHQVEQAPIAENGPVDFTLPGLPQMPALPSSAALTAEFDQPLLLPSLPIFPSLTIETNQEFPTTQESL